MSSDIFLFLSDEAFASLSSSSVVRYADISGSAGMLDDNLLNYFLDHSLFLDPVNTGVTRVRVQRSAVDQQTSYRPVGRMMLHFDAAKLLESDSEAYCPALINAFVVRDNESAALVKTKNNNLGALFNIVDTIFHSRNEIGRPLNADEINAILTDDTMASSTYNNYVPGSLKLATTSTRARTRLSDGSMSNERDYWDSCSFSFKYPTTENVSDTINFRIWLNSDQFKANYPFSTIVDCIYPFKPEWILRPTTELSQIRAILASSDYKNNMVDEAVTHRDHSGATILSSTYVVETNHTKISFLLMYKGNTPDSSAARQYLRNRLLSETDSSGNPLGSESDWRARLPDLFVDGEYYLIPMYHQRIAYPGNVYIERSLLNYQDIYSKVRAIISHDQCDDLTLMENLEVLQAPGHDIYIACIAANPSIQPPVTELHPTYESTDAISANWNKISELDKQFAKRLADCIAVCLGLADPDLKVLSDDVIGMYPAKAFVCASALQNTNMVYKMLVYDSDSPIWG